MGPITGPRAVRCQHFVCGISLAPDLVVIKQCLFWMSIVRAQPHKKMALVPRACEPLPVVHSNCLSGRVGRAYRVTGLTAYWLDTFTLLLALCHLGCLPQ